LVSKPAAQAPKTTPITSDAGTGAAGKPRGGLLAGHSPEDDQWAHLTVWELWGWVRARAGTPDHRVARARPPWPTPASSPSGRGTDDLLGPDRLLRPVVQLAGNLNGVAGQDELGRLAECLLLRGSDFGLDDVDSEVLSPQQTGHAKPNGHNALVCVHGR
jgi:hypothetical protein